MQFVVWSSFILNLLDGIYDIFVEFVLNKICRLLDLIICKLLNYYSSCILLYKDDVDVPK